MNNHIGIIDYGLSNLACVNSAVNFLGFKTRLIKKPDDFRNVSKIILPGVGAFGDAMDNLSQRNLLDELNENIIEKEKYFLGICLGAQLICRKSEEFGVTKGLGWIDADVKKIHSKNENLRIPHSGWNNIELLKKNILFKEIPSDSLFYFTHSFGIFNNDRSTVIGECNHGETFSVALNYKNIFGVQFHPEKSQKMGLTLLKNFLRL